MVMMIRFSKKIRETFLFEGWEMVLISTVIVTLICYFFIDIPLAHLCKTSPSVVKKGARFFSNLIDPKYHIFFWPFLYFVFRFLYKKEILANRCLLVLVTIPTSFIMTEILKKILGRARPELLFSHEQYGFTFFTLSNHFSSFPSGHACTIGAICGAFACLYPRLWVPLFLLSFILGFTRVILTAHFLSDVMIGVVIGFLVAQWVYKMMKKEHVRFFGR